MTVVAVLALSPFSSIWTGTGLPLGRSRPKPAGITSTARASLRSISRVSSASLSTIGDEIEVAGVDERRHQGAALGRPVAIVDRQRDVADVPVQRVAVQQQEERGNEQQDGKRPPVADDLADLLAADGESLPHASTVRSHGDLEEDVLERGLRPTRSTRHGMPAASSELAAHGIVVASVAAGSTAWTAVPNTLVFSTLRHRSSSRIASTGLRRADLEIGRSGEHLLQLLVVPSAASRPAWMIAIRWQCSASSR